MPNGYKVLCQPLRVGISLYRRGLQRCCSIEKGNAKASKRGTATVEFHVFLCAFSEQLIFINRIIGSSYAKNYFAMNIKVYLKNFILLNVCIIILCGCNKFPTTPIFEELSLDELQECIKKDPDFAFFYDNINSESLSIKMTPSQKVLFKDISYERLFKYFKNDLEWIDGYKDSICEREWKSLYSVKIDSIIAYWKQYPIESCKETHRYAQVQIIDVTDTTILFKITSNLSFIDRFEYSVRWPENDYYSEYLEKDICFSNENNNKIVKKKRYFTYEKKPIPTEVIVTTILFDDKEVKSKFREYSIPHTVRKYLAEPNEYKWEEIAEDFFVSKYDYFREKRAIDLINFDKLCYEFIEELDINLY